MQQKVMAHFERRPIAEVMHELAELTGVSIQVDPKIAALKDQPLVTATFRNDTSLRDAMKMLTEVAHLRLNELPTGVYVTLPKQ
jgi:hypothetical protein